MSKNFLIEATDSNGNSFLHFAAAKGHLDRLVHLIKNGSNMNAMNVFGWTPLMQAVRNGQTNTAKLLICNGADVMLKNNYGLSILSLAVASNNRETVELILSLREKISWSDDVIGPLSLAIVFNSQSIIELLLSKPEFSLTSPDPITYLTPTSYAFLTKNYNLLNSLLKKSHSKADMTIAKDSAIIAQIPNRKSIPDKSNLQVPMGYTHGMFRLSDSNQIQNWIRDLGGQMKRCNLSESIPKSSFSVFDDIIEGDDDVFEDEVHSSTIVSKNVLISNRRNEKQALQKLLRSHSLDSYMALFEKHEIDLNVLLTLSDTDLHEIGINCPEKRRLFLEMIFKTLLCNGIIDNIHTITKENLVERILEFLPTDTILFQSADNDTLYDLQKQEWDPIIKWFCDRYGVIVNKSREILNPTLDHTSKVTLIKHLLSYDYSVVYGILFGTESLKSLILTMASIEKVLNVRKAVLLSRLEQEFQLQSWSRIKWAHDLEHQDLQARLSAVVLFVYYNSNLRSKTLKN